MKKNKGSQPRQSRPASGPRHNYYVCSGCRTKTLRGKIYPRHMCKEEK